MEENRQYNNPPRRGGHGAGRPVEKSKDFKGTWIKILKYNKKLSYAMLCAVIFSVAATIFTLIGPDKLKDLTNTITAGFMTGVDMDKVFNIGITLVILYASGTVLSILQGQIMAVVTQKISKNLRNEISEKINRLPMWYYNTTSTGDILSRVTNDVDMIGQSLNMSVGMLISSVTLLLGSVFMMFKTNVLMTVTAILSSLFGFALMMIIMGKSQKYFKRQQKHLGEINGQIEEIYTGHTVVKAYNGEEKAAEEFNRMNENLRDSAFKAQCLSGLMMPIMNFIGNFGYVAVCIVGAVLAMNGKISFGVIVAFMIYIRLFTQPLSQIAQAMQSMQSAAAAAERVFEFVEAEEMENEDDKTGKVENVKGYVDFEHVKFGYKGSDKIVIKDFSVNVKPGQKIAIVGPTGAGKTTLCSLIPRFYDVTGGRIMIDGRDIRSVTLKSLRDHIGMVQQDVYLFAGTIFENIQYGKPGATREEVIEAAKNANAHEFIMAFPDGYDTDIGQRGIKLSGGQKQRLSIARVFLKNPPILIFDEATSALDNESEKVVQDSLEKLAKNRTTFVIAHRLTTIQNAEKILVLTEDGIAESGTHEELLAQGGLYEKLYHMHA